MTKPANPSEILRCDFWPSLRNHSETRRFPLDPSGVSC